MAQGVAGGERLHLPDGDLIEPFQPVALRQGHVDELGVHAFDVGEHEQLLDGGVVAHVAFELGIRIAPLPGGLAEEGDIEQVGFVGVGGGGLGGGDLGRDEVGFHRVGVDAVVQLGQGAVEVPGEGEAAIFVVLEALEFLDEVYFEFGADPHAEFKGDVLVGEGAAVTPGTGAQANGVGLGHPVFDADLVAVQAGLTFNCGEFAIIKTGVVDAFPDAQELDRVPVAQPVRNEEIPVLGFQHVRQRNKIFVLGGQDGDGSALNFDRRFLGLAHSVSVDGG